ncbi:hypothetical protein GCM10008969_33640 [Pseudomonas veronii subsp. inensis]|uniref:hypothetical protein n=1 Tax=Pseudomonas veronii TaxID=76761 RepID=UPI0031F926FA
MSDKRPESLKLKGDIGYALEVTKAMQGFTVSKEIYQIGEAVRALTENMGIFARSENFKKIGSAVQAFSANVQPLRIAADSSIGLAMKALNQSSIGLTMKAMSQSPIGIAMKAISQMNLELNISKSIMSAAKAVDSIGINQRYITEFLNSSINSELFELIRSGDISAAQIVSGFEEAVAVVGEIDDFSKVTRQVNESNVSQEVIKAFQNSGSLKGASQAALVYFLCLMLSTFTKDPIGSINKGFELQRNLSGLFTSAETPADARAQARHLPSGANKSDLTGFRVVTGSDVYLMDDPSRQAETVLKIRIGSLVQVLDSSDRAWLYVSVVMDDELYEGWILRSYTKRIE